MADNSENEAAAGVPAKKGSAGIFAILIPALVAGGAAFGGAKFAAAHGAVAPGASVEHAKAPPPPGPTVPLEPFLVVTANNDGKSHAMKVTLAVEFSESAKEETLKSFTPRIRDAALGYLRTLTYQDALDSHNADKIRADLLERFRETGATAVERVLITDLVIQ